MDYKNKYVIVRGDRSGVFAGNIKSRNGREICMTNVRRIWYWDGAASISQLAKDGVSNPENCKFTVSVDEMEILDAIEIIPCTEKSANQIKELKSWTR